MTPQSFCYLGVCHPDGLGAGGLGCSQVVDTKMKQSSPWQYYWGEIQVLCCKH